jgi:hypothetical protein
MVHSPLSVNELLNPAIPGSHANLYQKILMSTLHYSDHDCLSHAYMLDPPHLNPQAEIPVTTEPAAQKLYQHRHQCRRSTCPKIPMPYHDNQAGGKVLPHRTSTCRPTPNQTKVECVALGCNLGPHEVKHPAHPMNSRIPWKTWNFTTSNLV